MSLSMGAIIGLVVAGLGISVSEIDPTWATPVNSLLLLCIALVALYSNRNRSREQDEAKDERKEIAEKVEAVAKKVDKSTTPDDTAIRVEEVNGGK